MRCKYDLEIICPAQFLPCTKEPYFNTSMSSSFNDLRCMSKVHSTLSLHASQVPTKKEGENDGSYKMWNPRRWKVLVAAKYNSITTYAVCVLVSPVNFSYYCSPLPVGCQYWSDATSGARPRITHKKTRMCELHQVAGGLKSHFRSLTYKIMMTWTRVPYFNSTQGNFSIRRTEFHGILMV